MTWLRKAIGVLLLIVPTLAFAQQDYLVVFQDKGPEAVQWLKEPNSFLSQRAIERRALHQVDITLQDVPVSTSYLQQISSLSDQVFHTSKWLNAVHITSDISAVDIQTQLPFVRSVIPLKRNQSLNKRLEHLVQRKLAAAKLRPLDYGDSKQQIEMLNLDCLHDQGYEGDDVLVAVFDTGFIGLDTANPYAHLRNENRIVSTRNFVIPGQPVYTNDSHGSLVISAMVARDEGTYIGGATNASYVLAVTENLASETHQEELNWMAAAEWADSLGVDVIQSSLTYKYFDPGQGDYEDTDIDGKTAIITQAAQAAARVGIMVVQSAGNDGQLTTPLSNRVGPPCDGDSVLCVGSVDEFGVYHELSSRGPTADNRIKPDVVARGKETVVLNSSGSIFQTSGTSLSAPLVASVAICLKQAQPQKTNMEIIDAIRQSGDKADNPNNQYGYGLPDACKALQILQNPTGVADELVKNGLFKLYPTVSDHRFTVTYAGDMPISSFDLFVFDITGQIITQHKNSKVSQIIDATLWDSGVYIVKVLTEGGSSHLRFVKQ